MSLNKEVMMSRDELNDHVVKMSSDLFPVNRLGYFSCISWHYTLGVGLKNKCLILFIRFRSFKLLNNNYEYNTQLHVNNVN